jgi:hypothetical protein
MIDLSEESPDRESSLALNHWVVGSSPTQPTKASESYWLFFITLIDNFAEYLNTTAKKATTIFVISKFPSSKNLVTTKPQSAPKIVIRFTRVSGLIFFSD